MVVGFCRLLFYSVPIYEVCCSVNWEGVSRWRRLLWPPQNQNSYKRQVSFATHQLFSRNNHIQFFPFLRAKSSPMRFPSNTSCTSFYERTKTTVFLLLAFKRSHAPLKQMTPVIACGRNNPNTSPQCFEKFYCPQYRDFAFRIRDIPSSEEFRDINVFVLQFQILFGHAFHKWRSQEFRNKPKFSRVRNSFLRVSLVHHPLPNHVWIVVCVRSSSLSCLVLRSAIVFHLRVLWRYPPNTTSTNCTSSSEGLISPSLGKETVTVEDLVSFTA